MMRDLHVCAVHAYQTNKLCCPIYLYIRVICVYIAHYHTHRTSLQILFVSPKTLRQSASLPIQSTQQMRVCSRSFAQTHSVCVGHRNIIYRVAKFHPILMGRSTKRGSRYTRFTFEFRANRLAFTLSLSLNGHIDGFTENFECYWHRWFNWFWHPKTSFANILGCVARRRE